MTATELDWHRRIGEARRLIESRLDDDVPLDELARAAHYSTFHFHRLFRGLTGETVRAYTRRLRLERAGHRLTHGGDDILRIAMDAGYESHEAFTRAFKTRFGVTPSAFRDERREVHARRTLSETEHIMDVRIERRRPARIACVRHVGPYDQVGEAWGKLMKWGWSKMMFGAPETFGLCFDDPDVTPAAQVRYEACMAVNGRARARGDVQLRDMEGGVYAVTVHEGPFESIGATYARLFACIASGPIDGRTRTLGDPPTLEKYLTDPRKTRSQDLRTELWVPVGD